MAKRFHEATGTLVEAAGHELVHLALQSPPGQQALQMTAGGIAQGGAAVASVGKAALTAALAAAPITVLGTILFGGVLYAGGAAADWLDGR